MMVLAGMADDAAGVCLLGRRRRATTRSRLIALFLCLGSIEVHAQAPVWISPWRVQSPTQFFTGTPPDFAFSADGELTFAQIAPSGLDYQYARINGAGTARWSTNLGVQFYTELGDAKPLLPYPDGSAIVALDLGYPEFSRIARVAADGSLQWIRAIEADTLVALPHQQVLAASCPSLTVLDATTGQIAWQYGNPGVHAASCFRNRATADADGNIYSATVELSTPYQFQLRTIKLDPTGHALWQDIVTAGSAGNGEDLIGVSDGLLFLRTYGELRVLHQIDGTLAWSIPFSNTSSNAVVLAGDPEEAVLIDGATASRLANDTGMARWSTGLPASVTSATVAGGAVLALQSGALSRVDADGGSILWQTPLPSTDADSNQLTFLGAGLMEAGTLVAVAGRVSLFAAPPFLQQLDFTTGQPTGTIDVAPVAQGLMASSIVEDATHIVDAAVVVGSDSWNVRVRRLDAGAGTVLWESSEPLPPIYPSITFPYHFTTMASAPAIAIAGSEIAVGMSIGNELNVVAFERSSGAVRWSKSFAEVFVSAVNFAGPAIDSDENVYIEDNLTYSCSVPYLYCCPDLATTCHALRLYKLAAADGATIWQREGPPVSAPVLVFSLIGSDVILGGPFTGDLVSSTLARLSGADGSTSIWSSSVLPDYGVNSIFPLPDGSIEVTGNGFARLDVATGNTLWSKPFQTDPVCTQENFCHGYDTLAVPNGDLYSIGESNRTLRVQRLRGDGSGQSDFWYPVPAVSGARLVGTQMARSNDGQLWLRLSRSAGGPATLALLAAFDPISGTISAQQVIGEYDNTDSLGTSSGALMLSAPESGMLAVQTLVSEPPLPATYGDALLNVGILAHGDLSVSAFVDSSPVMPGDIATFHVLVSYFGDAPTAGVQLIAALPWASGATSLACNTAGVSNCAIDARADALRAKFDMDPGGSAEITGSVMVTDLDSRNFPPVIRAVVYGRPGLAEPETVDNFTSVRVTQSIFYNGFD